MRNLKRALSLTLASVMLLGMMVVGSSAAAGYSDVDENDNVEAIEVLQAVEVMVGDDRGFGPDRPVTRNEMAVVMGKLLNLDYNYYSSTCPFTDVADWAKGWVGACAANGIVSGRGNGIYDGEATVTAIEAASMMMRALGYFKNIEDYADGFATVTVRQGSRIGIFDQVGTDANTAMTRNQVAQMALNALRSEMVDFTGTPGIDVNGVKVGYRAEYTPRTSTEAKYNAIEGRTSDVATEANHKGQYYVQLGEQLYDGKLVLHEYSDDDFMRPARNWEYKGKDIGTYMKKENIRAEYKEGVSRRTLYDLLGKTNLVDYDFNYYVDGVAFNTITAEDILTRSTNDYGTTGRGVLTQVFVDIDAETIDVVSINTYLAQAASDYSSSTEKANLNVYYTYTGNKSTTTSKTVALADVDNIENIKQDDFKLVNVSGKNNSNATQATHPDYNGNMSGYDVIRVSDVEILTDSKLTEFSRSDGDKDADGNTTGSEAIFKSVTTGGTKYEGAYFAVYSDEVLDLYANDRLVNKTYNVYLDPYGNAIGVDLYSGDDNYVFITGVDLDSSNISLGTAKAAAIFPDGTMRTITVNVRETNKNIEKVDAIGSDAKAGSYFEQWKAHAKDGITGKEYVLNRWYTYTMDANNEYTLNPATRMIVTSIVDTTATDADDTIIKCNSVRIDEKVSLAGDTYTGSTVQNDGVNRYAAGRNTTRTYGNDNSVYIVVEAEEPVTNSGTEHVISDVTGVYTGVQNVEIKVTGPTTANAKIAGTALYDSIFTVYDKNNYIIASVVLGEAQGGNANYVYTLTNAKSERLLDDGTTEWTFDAIVDGTKQTLTARSKYTKTIADLQPGHVQELRYDGEYVVGVKTVDITDTTKVYTDPTAKMAKQDLYDVGHSYILGNVSAPDCPDSTHAGGRISASNATSLRMVGRTMYLGVGYDQGLTFVSENAPAVVIQKEDGSWKLTEHASVASAIGAMGDADAPATPANKAFAGRIVAALNDQGVAKWVVFISDTGITSAGVSVPSNGDDTVTVDPATNTVTVTTVKTPDGIAQIAEKVRKEMEKQGYSDIEITVEGDEITKITGKRNGVKYTMKQAGTIEILTDAQLAEKAAEKVTNLTKNIDLTADNMIAGGEAAAKAAAKAAVKQAVETGRAAGDPAPAEPDTVKTTNGFTLTFTWGAYTAPTTSNAGSIVINSLAIKKGTETETLTNVTFAIAKLTQEEQDEIDAAADQTAVNAVKAEIEKLTFTVANADVTGADDEAKIASIKTAITSAIENKYGSGGVTGVITVSDYVAAVDGVKDDPSTSDVDETVAAKNGSFNVSVALTLNEATATATKAGTITATPAA